MGISLPEYIEVLDTRDNTKKGKTLRYKGRLIHSLYDPQKEAQDMMDKVRDLDRYRIIIILGLGLGYVLEALLERTSLKDKKVLVVEQEGDFQPLLMRDYHQENIFFFFHREPDEVLHSLLDKLETVDLRDILFLENKTLTQIGKEYYDRIKEKLMVLFRQQVADLTTTSYFSGQWLFNSFINLKRARNVAFLQDLQEYFSGQTALLVSSGPSVEGDLPFLRDFKGVLFCLPPSVPFLLKNGIKPDFIVLGDSGFSNLFHLRKAFSSKLNLICDLSVHYSLLSLWQGPVIIMNSNIPGFEFFYEKFALPYMPQGGTVASTVLYIIRYMGMEKVILSGQDFAYEDLKLHVKGSGYEQYHLLRTTRMRTRLDLNFEQIRNNRLEYKDGLILDQKLMLYKEWFYDTARFLKLNLVPKDPVLVQDKKPFKVRTQSRIPEIPELKVLKKRIGQIKPEGSVQEFMERMKHMKGVLSLLESLDFPLFFKIKKGTAVDPGEFHASLLGSLKKLNFLLDYNS